MKHISTTFARLWLAAVASASGLAWAGDWPAWRGPANTGVSYEKNLPQSTKDVLWRAPLPGRSTPAIVDGRVYLINLAGEGVHEQERLMALDLATGKTIWEYRFNVFHTDIANARVGWANVAADPETGYVYAHGVQGLLLCLDRDGKLIWSRSLTEEFGRITGYGGRIHTPVLDEDRLIIGFNSSSFGEHAKGGHRYAALDKRTGEILWWAEPGGPPTDTTYATPVVAVIDGQRLIVAGNADGWIYAMQARTGKKVWGFHLSQSGINTAVVVDGYRVYASHSEENLDTTTMGRVVAIDGRGSGDITASNELWRADGVEAGYASPVFYNGRLYAMTNFGVLYCLDGQSGKEHWRYTVGRIGKGSPVWGDGKIYATVANGSFAILEDAGSEAKLIDRMTFRDPGELGIELFASPAVADGKVVFFTTSEMLCLGKKDAERQQVEVPPLPPEKPLDKSAPPALVQVRPGEVSLAAGEKTRFKAYAYDANGGELGELAAEKVAWSVDPALGSVDKSGALVAAKHGGSGSVAAKLGELAATARVRIIPRLPIEENFDDLASVKQAEWWIGVSAAKYNLEDVQGNKALVKLADARGPIFNRSQVYITPPIEPGYTVQADVMGVAKGRQRGDVGLINARYRLELFGRVKRARIVSWIPQPRFETKLEGFTWDADRWYTLKFHVDVKDGKGYVRAKIWPRGEEEPQEWTLEGVDPQPNTEGSAGLYAYSAAPLYFDNVRVYREGDRVAAAH